MEALVFLLVVGAAIFVLKGFDNVAGRGPKQVADGIKQASRSAQKAGGAERIPCPQCAEQILPAAKICPFCKSSLSNP